MEYDYIVVGAGSAGAAVAARLSEDPHCQVLLLEAGGSHRNMEISTPGMVGTLWRTKHDWAFYTTHQPGLNGRKHFWPRGKVLGGTSCLNYMIYIFHLQISLNYMYHHHNHNYNYHHNLRQLMSPCCCWNWAKS